MNKSKGTEIKVTEAAKKFTFEAERIYFSRLYTQASSGLASEDKFLKELHSFLTSNYNFNAFLREQMFVKSIDNFFSYITDILFEIFHSKPQMLANTQVSIPIESILKHKNHHELIQEIIEQQVHKYSYKSIKDLSKFLKNNFKFPLFKSEEDYKQLHLFNEYRNLLVHNRGIINSIFLKKIPKSEFVLGDRLEITKEDFNECRFLLERLVGQIEDDAIEKFELETPAVLIVSAENLLPTF